jgi:putative lipoprotein
LTIREQNIANPEKLPLPFTLLYEPKGVLPERTYVMKVDILNAAGNTLYETPNPVPVLTQGSPSTGLEIMVQPVGSPGLSLPVGPGAGANSVSGVATYLGADPLPEDAALYIQIEDAKQSGAPVPVLGSQMVTDIATVPIPFAVEYDPTEVDETRDFVVKARIANRGGAALYVTTGEYRVITGGGPTSGLELVLQSPGISGAGGGASVSGVLTYMESLALPADAIAYVKLVDITNTAAPLVVNQATLPYPGQPPIPFSLAYNPDTIQESHKYVIQARITDSRDNLMFTTTLDYLVITQGHPTTGLQVILDMVVKG